MSNPFFDQPILNSPYARPSRHWELDVAGQPTQIIVEARRQADFITPIPKPRKQKGAGEQGSLLFDEGKGLSSEKQQYDHTAVINAVRAEVDKWRELPASAWRVTPETARLLQHWRGHRFSGLRPFFCQIEAVETAIWLTEVAPQLGKSGQRFPRHSVLRFGGRQRHPIQHRGVIPLGGASPAALPSRRGRRWQSGCAECQIVSPVEPGCWSPSEPYPSRSHLDSVPA